MGSILNQERDKKMTRQKYIKPSFPEAAFVLALVVGEISGSQYFLGSKGKATCSGGDVITNSGTCREACSALDISFKEQDIKSGYPCYRDVRGKCYKNGLDGDGAS